MLLDAAPKILQLYHSCDCPIVVNLWLMSMVPRESPRNLDRIVEIYVSLSRSVFERV